VFSYDIGIILYRYFRESLIKREKKGLRFGRREIERRSIREEEEEDG
jgi:hypothetical protein